jgi:hypothetical protein
VSRRTEFIERFHVLIAQGYALAREGREKRYPARDILVHEARIAFLEGLVREAEATTDEDWEARHPRPGFWERLRRRVYTLMVRVAFRQ